MDQQVTKRHLKIAILNELNQVDREQHKVNLLGNNPGQRGPIENRLNTTFNERERALAAQAFDELKREGLTYPPYSPGQTDPDNWVKITDEGKQALQTGILPSEAQSAQLPGEARLTKFGVPNHLAFIERMKALRDTTSRVSLLFLDLDGFKSVNDDFNHTVGDQLIKETMAIIEEVIKSKGELFHRDGDEMLILLLNFDEDEALPVAERIRKAIQQKEFSTVGAGKVTATIGLTTYPDTCADWEKLEVTADEIMAKAKKNDKKNSVAH